VLWALATASFRALRHSEGDVICGLLNVDVAVHVVYAGVGVVQAHIFGRSETHLQCRGWQLCGCIVNLFAVVWVWCRPSRSGVVGVLVVYTTHGGSSDAVVDVGVVVVGA